MQLLCLTSYQLGSPLFLTGLSRDLAARGGGGVALHGSGERGERALEALGVEPTHDAGAWRVRTDDEAAAVERAARDLNREIAHELNEAGVATIRAMGADRGLLKRGGEDALETGRTEWLSTLAEQGVVAVVAAFVDGAPALREVSLAAAAAALGQALGQPVTLLTERGIGERETLQIEEDESFVPDPVLARDLLARGAAVRVVDRAGLRAGAQGGRVSA